MFTTTQLSMLGAAIVLALLILATLAYRGAQKAQAKGYDLGYNDAKLSHNSRISALHEDIEHLHIAKTNLIAEHRLQLDAITQDCDARIAIFARRSNPCTEADALILDEAASMADILGRTYNCAGATNKASQANKAAQQILNLAQRVRAALEAPTTTDAARTKRAVLVFGPQCCGKTRNAQAIADALGLNDIRDDWQNGMPVPRLAALVLTNDSPPFNIPAAMQVLSYADAMQLVEAKSLEEAA